MEFSDALRHILDGEAVLFLGTGFSCGAKNYAGNSLLSPSKLANHLYSAIGIPEAEQNGDLGQASDLYLEIKGEFALVDLLKELYTVSDITEDQLFIGSRKWRRVYTTNYDNVLEKSLENNHRQVLSAVLSQKPFLFTNKDGMCIHLNGSITNLEPERLGTEFKLTDRSYLEEAFLDNEWMSFFRSDLRTAKAVFFVGYSMKFDLDLKRIIFNTNGLKEKTFFIVAETEPSLNLLNLKKFGTPLTIGLSGFVSELKALAKTYHPVSILNPILFSFEKVENPRTPSRIVDSDVFKLFVNGEFSRDKVYSSIVSPHDYPYYINRDKISSACSAIMDGERNLLIHSDLGNGKTLIVNGIACRLVEHGYSVFFYRRYEVSVDREIESICSSHEKTAIIIDGYADKFDLLRTLSRCRTDQVIILCERSAIFDITYEDIDSLFGGFIILDVNKLSPAEIKAVDQLFLNNGLWGEMSARREDEREFFLSNSCHAQFREIVLKLLDSPDIKSRFEVILSSVRNKSGFYEAVVFILICQVCNIDLDLEQLASGLNVSKLNSPAFRNDSVVREFVDFDREAIKPKSAIVAEKLLQSIVDSELVVDVVVEIFKKLDSYQSQYEVAHILRNLLDYTHIQQFLNKNDNGYKRNLLRYYETLRTTSFCRENADFWLQYAIVKISQSDFPQARLFFETAYSFAKKKGQNPYKIDNHYARYLLEEQIKFGKQESCMDAFRQAHELLIDDKRRRGNFYYPYRVARNYYPFYQRFFSKMSKEDQSYFMACCRQMLERIKRYLNETNTGNVIRDVVLAKSDLEKILS